MSTRDPLDGDTGDGPTVTNDTTLLDGETGDENFTESVHLEGDTGGDLSMDDCPLPLPIGSKFYRFTLNGLLGRGGTGVVYSATTKRSSDVFAVKVFWPHLRTRPEIEQHFRSGHLLAKDLYQQCPGIVPIHQVDEKNGFVFVKMSPVPKHAPLTSQLIPPSDRESFRGWLKQIFQPLCQTVDRLHDFGIAHCDLKASNILLADGQRPTVVDFGLALDIRSGLQQVMPNAGTQTIMAPEQYTGLEVGPSVDRYALGLLVYRYLAGQYPWEKSASHHKIRQQKETNRLQPLTSPLVDSLTGLSDIVHQMLQRDPVQRFSRCSEFCAKLLETTELIRVDTSSNIQQDDRIRLRSHTADPLETLRLEKIKTHRIQRMRREPELVSARRRVEELQRILQQQHRAEGTLALTELRRLLQKFPVWELAPLQRLPYSTSKGIVHHFRLLPAGRFQMGSSMDDSQADGGERPRFGVYISEGFWMGETPVNQELYQSIMGVNPSFIQMGTHPVTNVSWFDAIQFCNRFSEHLNFQPVYEIGRRKVSVRMQANGFRLPTEAEWEFAALAGQESNFSGSSQASKVAWYHQNSGGVSHPSGIKDSNGFGLFDMSGNVWEWVWDWYGDYPKTTEGTLFQHNPSGPLKGDSRVLRGGSYESSVDQVRVKARWAEFPNESASNIGFRLVQAVRY